MPEYSQPLGDAVRRAREELSLTQLEVAEAADIDVRTVLNIENYKGNPKLEVLFPLVRALKMDSREIFHPEMLRDNPSIRRLRFIVMFGAVPQVNSPVLWRICNGHHEDTGPEGPPGHRHQLCPQRGQDPGACPHRPPQL